MIPSLRIPCVCSRPAMAAAASAGETSGAAAGEALAAPSMEASSVEAQTMVADNAIMETRSAIAPLLSEVQSAIAEMEPALAEPLPIGHAETARCYREPVLAPRSRPRIRKFTAKLSVLPACWSMRSNSTIRRKVAEGRQNQRSLRPAERSDREEPRYVPEALREHGCRFRQLLST